MGTLATARAAAEARNTPSTARCRLGRVWLTFDGDDRAELVGWLCDRDLTHPKVDEYLREAGVVDVGGPQLIARHRPGYADPCRCPLTEAVRNGTA